MEFYDNFVDIKNSLGISCEIKLVNNGNGYCIQNDGDNYIINYNQPCDALRALLTIKAGVNDNNRSAKSFFNELGFMVDLSRNAVLNLKTMEKLVNYLALLGYNQLYLYMEDTYEVQNQPYFGHLRGRYSFKELKDIDKMCAKVGIEAIPCVQTLAHLNCMFKWDEYCDIKDIDDILLVNNDKTYALIEDMLSTLRSCFKTNKIHIGMDEAHHIGLGKYLDMFGYQDRFTIMYNHINKVKKICNKYDFTPMIWSDMFFRLAFGGNYYGDNKISQEVLDKIPDNVELVYWDYYQTNKEKYDEMIKKHKLINKNVRFAGGAWKWTGFAPNNKFGMKTSIEAVKSLIDNDVSKVMVTAWGDNGAECSVFSCLPEIVYYGQAKYFGKVDFEDKEMRKIFTALTKCSFDAFMELDIANDLFSSCDTAFPNPSKYLLYNDLLLGSLDTRVPEGANEYYEKCAKRLHTLAVKNRPFSYIFQTLSSLCEVLSVKAELGLHIQEHYLDYDTQEIVHDQQDILEVIQITKEFYQDFSDQWYRENKPHGFDVQDARIGGLIFRMESVYNRLGKFASNGDEIPELHEEKLLAYKNNDSKTLCVNNYLNTITKNII